MRASLKLRGNNRSSKRRWAHYLDAGGRESLRSLKRPCCPRSLKSLSSGGRSWRWATAAVEVDLEDELQVGSGGVHGQRVTGDPGGGCLRWCGAPSPASPNPRLPAPGAASLPAPGVVRLPPNSPRRRGRPRQTRCDPYLLSTGQALTSYPRAEMGQVQNPACADPFEAQPNPILPFIQENP